MGYCAHQEPGPTRKQANVSKPCGQDTDLERSTLWHDAGCEVSHKRIRCACCVAQILRKLQSLGLLPAIKRDELLGKLCAISRDAAKFCFQV